jgi:predicted dehydrogenase
MTVRVGVIGTGFGARVVAPVFSETEGCEVVEVVSARDDAGVANLCDRADVDLVSVHSPPFLHSIHVRRALQSHHAVLCDKPFGNLADHAETMLAAAEAAECVHLLNFEFRYDPIRQLFGELLAGGAIGDPEHVSWTHLSSGSRVPLRPHGWLFDRAQGGGWVGAWGSHAVDTLRVWFGEVATVKADCRTMITERPDRDGAMQKCDAEDAFSAWLVHEGGVSVAIDSTFAAASSMAPRLIATGSEGILECIADERIVVRRADGEREEHPRPESDVDPHRVPMRRFAEVVRDAVEAGAAPPGAPTFADGLACVRVLEQLRS